MFVEEFLGENCPLFSGKSLSHHHFSLFLDMIGNITHAVVDSQNRIPGREADITNADRCRGNPALGEQLDQILPETSSASSISSIQSCKPFHLFDCLSHFKGAFFLLLLFKKSLNGNYKSLSGNYSWP